jgi:outer membrane protein assembly factor BamE (lipoprotein component of BamABCDE complex)
MNVRPVILLLLTLSMMSCSGPKGGDAPTSTTSTIRRGRDFDSSKVKEIQKNKTTTEEITQWFGQPYATKIISTNQIGWLYSWRKSTVTVDRLRHAAKGKETGYRKRLELLISDGIVVNYTFEEGPFDAEGNRELK